MSQPSSSSHASGNNSQGRRGLTPISTNTNPPNSQQPQQQPQNTSSRQATSRTSSFSSSSTLFSPTGLQQLPPGQLLSSARSRAIAPTNINAQGSSAAVTPSTSQGTVSGGSGSGGGASRVARASPSLSQSSVGSPTSAQSGGQSGLTKIVITQLFLLLSSIKDEKDKNTKFEQIRKLVDSNGMEVFTKYFRRLVQQNAGTIFPNQSRSGDSSTSYQILVTEMQKLSPEYRRSLIQNNAQSPEARDCTPPAGQAYRIAESIEAGDGDIFRDFDLSTFISHFMLEPLPKTMLVLAFKRSSKPDLRAKADKILGETLQSFFSAIATPSQPQDPQVEEESNNYLTTILDRLIQDPPRANWTEETQKSLDYALRLRYQRMATVEPFEISSVRYLMELTGSPSPLLRLIQRTGPRATSSPETCKDMLAQTDTRDISYQTVASALLYMVIVENGEAYKPSIFISGLREHRMGQRLDWSDVVGAFDREGLRITKRQFLALYESLLPLAKEYENFDIQSLWGGTWNHGDTQLSFVSAFLSTSSNELDVTQIPRLRRAFTVALFDDAPEEAKAFAVKAVKTPPISYDAVAAFFNLVFRNNETYIHAKALRLIEKVIDPNNGAFICSSSALPKPWGPTQDQAMKQLFYTVLTKQENIARDSHSFAFHGMWKHDKQWVAQRFIDYYLGDQTMLPFIFEHAVEHDLLETLINSIHHVFVLDLAFLAHSRDLVDLDQWLQRQAAAHDLQFVKEVSDFLTYKASQEHIVQRENAQPSTTSLAIKTVFALLGFLQEHLADEDLVSLQRQCVQVYPRLINYGEGFDLIIDANSKQGHAFSTETDAKMQEHFRTLYSGESQVNNIIEVLQKYKTSEDPFEQDLFSCTIHGLFDEYHCYGDYPLEALATTSVLFGGVINFNLLSRVGLQVGLGMVLEAVEKYTTADPMYKFGLQALLQCADRLPEWPGFCERLVCVPGLQGTEVFNKAQQVLQSQNRTSRGGEANGDAQANLPNGNVDYFDAEAAVPNFTSLHVDPPLHPDNYREPDEEVQDKVLFIFNNVSERNLDVKLKDLKVVLDDTYSEWFAKFLVEERAKSQPNLHQLYLDLLEHLDRRILWAEVLRETYACSIRLLQAESTLKSVQERNHLKNMAVWLGSLTLARNKPIKLRNISFKDLLIEAYDTERLVIAIPFTCKVLERATKSTIFKPPNAWTDEIVGILLELYHFCDIKINMKFEIEWVCRALGIDTKTFEPSDVIRSRPQPEEEFLQSTLPDGVLEGTGGFSDLSLLGTLNRPRADTERFSPAAILASLPDLTSILVFPPTTNSVAGQERYRQIFINAVQQAVSEIISPVVERSVTIATICTSSITVKDFAMEPDENRLRECAHNVVKSLSGGLALVTCKEPLRMSISNNIRRLASFELPQDAIPEGHLLMFVNDNLDKICNMVESAAETRSIAEIESQIALHIEDRRSHARSGTTQPFMSPHPSEYSNLVPHPYKLAPGGLNREQLAVYEDFGRHVRLPSGAFTGAGSQDSGRQLPDVLQDQVPSMNNGSNPPNGLSMSRHAAEEQALLNTRSTMAAPGMQQHVNGSLDAHSVSERVAELLNELQRVTYEAPQEHIKDLPQLAPTRGIFERLVLTLSNIGHPQRDSLVLETARKATSFIYSDDAARLEIEVFVQLLVQCCHMSVVTAREVLPWFAHLDDERIFKTSVTACLISAGLIDVSRVDAIFAKAIRERRGVAVEAFDQLTDDVLLGERPGALRADFAKSFEALSMWMSEDAEIHAGKSIYEKLQRSTMDAVDDQISRKSDQMLYIFDEWVTVQRPSTADKSLAAFVHQMHQKHILSNRDDCALFLRVALDASVEAYQREESNPQGTLDDAYVHVDALAKLVAHLVLYHEEPNGVTKSSSKSVYFDSVLALVCLVLNHHHITRAENFNQKVFYRLLSSLMVELHQVPGQLGAAYKDCMLTLGKATLYLEPANFPGFAFAWQSLIAHRLFIPAMMKLPDQAGWPIYTELLEILLAYAGELVTFQEPSVIAKEVYRGLLRILLVLHHDFPEFLAENHFRLCSAVPTSCIQVRNLIVSAYPSSFPELPDPFTVGLKVDRLEEVRRTPVVRGDFETPLRDAGIKDVADDILRRNDSVIDVSRIKGALIHLSKSADLTLNALVLYIAQRAVQVPSTKSGPAFSASSSHARLLYRLAHDLDLPTRYLFINAIANQLRYPNAHTYYYSYALLHIFGAADNASEDAHNEVQQQVITVLLERLVVNRPHPWGLIITLLEILKNPTYQIWELPFMKAAPDVERYFNGLFQHRNGSPRTLT